MNKNTETTQTDENIKGDAIENIDSIELDSVTGGCSRCGCGQPDTAVSQPQLAAPSTWLRR